MNSAAITHPSTEHKPAIATGGMKAMIFCAGMGTRFKPWTDKHPKALALVNGKSLLQRNVEYLQKYNIKDVVINVHHFAEQIIEAVEKNDGDRQSSRKFLFDADDRLCGWENNLTGEKKMSRNETHLKSKAYSCVVVFDPEIFERIPQRGKFSLVETYLSLAKDELIFGYDHSGDKLIDVGKPESVAVAEGMFE